MIIDTSAGVALLRDESEAPAFPAAIERARSRRISVVGYVEAAAVINRSGDAVAKRALDAV